MSNPSAIAAVVAFGGAIALGLGMKLTRRVVVTGDSMLPTLQPGDRLLAIVPIGVRPGDLVVVPDPRAPERLLVKRLASITNMTWELRGDNQEFSTDSRAFGTVPKRSILGRVIYRYAPASRAGRLLRPVPSPNPVR